MSGIYDRVTQTPLSGAADETLGDMPKSKGGTEVEIRGCHHVTTPEAPMTRFGPLLETD